MPRIYSSVNDPLDFCRRHFPTELIAKQRYGSLGDAADGRGNRFGYNADHPPYEYADSYRCLTCRKFLTQEDN